MAAFLAGCHAKSEVAPSADAAVAVAESPRTDSSVSLDAAASSDASPPDANADAATFDAGLAEDKNPGDLRWRKKDAIAGLARTCSWAPPVVPPPKLEGAGAYSERTGSDALSFDCEDIELSQGCVFDPCANAADACTAARAKDCRTCGQTCIDTCGSCEAACSDDACRSACAARTAICHETCMKVRHDAYDAKCANLHDDCGARMTRQWNANHCDATCAAYVKCRDACVAEAGTSDMKDDAVCPRACKHTFTKACPGNGLDVACLANGAP